MTHAKDPTKIQTKNSLVLNSLQLNSKINEHKGNSSDQYEQHLAQQNKTTAVSRGKGRHLVFFFFFLNYIKEKTWWKIWEKNY